MAWLFNVDTVENWAYMENVFSQEECDKIKRIALKKEKQSGVILGNNNEGKVNKDVRESNIIWISEKDEELHWVYSKLAGVAMSLNNQFFKFDLFGFCEDMQFTEYSAPGGVYKEHMDRMPHGRSRKLSLVVQLTDPNEYEGGELLINLGAGERQAINKSQGTVVAFSSWIMHEVTPVTKGTRHSLVAWIGGPNFK